MASGEYLLGAGHLRDLARTMTPILSFGLQDGLAAHSRSDLWLWPNAGNAMLIPANAAMRAIFDLLMMVVP